MGQKDSRFKIVNVYQTNMNNSKYLNFYSWYVDERTFKLNPAINNNNNSKCLSKTKLSQNRVQVYRRASSSLINDSSQNENSSFTYNFNPKSMKNVSIKITNDQRRNSNCVLKKENKNRNVTFKSQTMEFEMELLNDSLQNNLELNQAEKELLFYTYNIIKCDLNQLGVIAFMKTFETLPDIKDSFDSFRFLPIDELSTSHALRTHSRKVMNIIEQLLAAMQTDQMEEYNIKLIKLGERHFIYRAKKDFFQVIKYQFVNAIRPIILKNLGLMTINSLVELSSIFNVLIDFENVENLRGNEFFRDRLLSKIEIQKASKMIEELWKKLFDIMIYHMNLGMESREANKT